MEKFRGNLDECKLGPSINLEDLVKSLQLYKLDLGALGMSDPCWPLNPIQYPVLTVFFRTFTFVLIDLLSPVKW